MIIVSDTTAITSLLKINRATLLCDLFGEVFIPEAVRNELLRYHTTLPDFLEVHSISNSNALHSLRHAIGDGEAEAIILAEELRADALLIDDKQGRSMAEHRGIPCLGLAGALLMAKQKHLISSLAEILNILEDKANFYLDSRLKRSLLTTAREV